MPNPTPLQTALGTGAVLGGIYGNVQNPGAQGRNVNQLSQQGMDLVTGSNQHPFYR